MHETFHDYTVNDQIKYDFTFNPVCVKFFLHEIKIYKGEKFKRKLNIDAKGEKLSGVLNLMESHRVLHDPTFRYKILRVDKHKMEYYCEDENSSVYKFVILKDKIFKLFDINSGQFNKCIIYHGDYEESIQSWSRNRNSEADAKQSLITCYHDIRSVFVM